YHAPGKSSFAFIFSLGGENRIVRAVNEGLGSLFSDGVLWYTREIDFIRRTRPLALFSPFITSHDKNRSATQLHSLEQRKMSAALLLLSPGAPFVYYGEEIGLWGEKPQNESNDDRVVRGPMIFDMDFPSPGRPNPFLWYWKQSDWDNGQGLPTLVGNKQDGVREQMLDEDSLLRYFIRIQNIKKRYPWIAWGRVDDSGISRISGDGRNPGNIAVYRVTDNKPGSSTFGRSVVIAHNTSRGNNHEAVRLPRARGNYAISALGNAQFPFVIEGDDNIFWLKPYTTAIFEEFDRD
ncbi:MAG: hypothetical protein LBC80_10755, partial [Treponema sp.]|nr:hypothetical protein [Treponema sp.]